MQDSSLKLSDFDYPVPEELIAQVPLTERDASKLLVRLSSGQIKHTNVQALTTELEAGTLLIFNDSKVIASRMFGTLSTGGRIELFLLAPVSPLSSENPAAPCWRALGRPLKKLNKDVKIKMAGNVTATILAKETSDDGSAFVTVSFSPSQDTALRPGQATPFVLEDWLDAYGYVPLPPYIHREAAKPAVESLDRDRYQTIYASERGSVAAPTAGLHFSQDLLDKLRAGGIETATVCLHVGAGTFLPVKNDDVSKHQMHSERYLVPPTTLTAIEKARQENRPIVTVGTTSLRTLESLEREARQQGVSRAALAGRWLSTDLFVYPKAATDRYKPWAATGLITNFHQPCSTLFMLICGLIGLEEARELYTQATKNRYRLFSYGDTSLLWL